MIFWALLALGLGMGAAHDPKKTEDITRIMKETKIAVVLEKGAGPPEGYEIKPAVAQVRGGDTRGPADGKSQRIGWRARLQGILKFC